MRELPGLAALILLISLVWAPSAAMASGQTIAEDVTVTVDPTTASVVLGDSLDLSITVTNAGREATQELVAHIDITDPTDSASVDPEDWTSTLSKPVGSLEPGESAVVGWTIQPISAGSFALYAVAIEPGAETIAASNLVQIDVDDQRSLNPNGILPVALAAPTVVGGLLVFQLRGSRRRGAASSGP